MSEINLIKIESKAIEKLIDTVKNFLGKLYKPRAIRNEADAEAYRIETIEKAKSKALASSREIDLDAFERISERFMNKELKRQENIDQITESAAQILQNENTVSEEPVNEDWISRFFNIAEDISDKDMQIIWSRILAGEVKKPKSYSLRTLELLKNLSKDEALLFMKIANLAILPLHEENYLVFNPNNGKYLEEKFKIKLSDILLLVEIGVLCSNRNLSLDFESENKYKEDVIIYQDKGIILKINANPNTQRLPVLVFTKISTELLQLVQPTFNLEYIKEIKKYIRNDKIEVKMGDLQKNENGIFDIINIVDIPD